MPPVPPGQILSITNSSDGRTVTFTVPLPPNTFSPYPPSYPPPSQNSQWYYSPQRPSSPYVTSPPVYGFPPYPPAPTNLAYPIITNPGYVPPNQLPQDLQNTLQIPYAIGPPLYLQPYPQYPVYPPNGQYGQYETTPGPYGVLPHRPMSEYGSSYGGTTGYEGSGVPSGRPVYGLFSDDTTTGVYVAPAIPETTATNKPGKIKTVETTTTAPITTTSVPTTTTTTTSTVTNKGSDKDKKKGDEPIQAKIGAIPTSIKNSDGSKASVAAAIEVTTTFTIAEVPMQQVADTGETTTEPPFSAAAPDEVTVPPIEIFDTTKRRKNKRKNIQTTEEPSFSSGDQGTARRSSGLSLRLRATQEISQESHLTSATVSTSSSVSIATPDTSSDISPTSSITPTRATKPRTTTASTFSTSTRSASVVPSTETLRFPSPSTENTAPSPKRQRRQRGRRTTTLPPDDYEDSKETNPEEYDESEEKILSTRRRYRRPHIHRKKSSVIITTSVELQNDGFDNPFSIVTEDDTYTQRPKTRQRPRYHTTTSPPDYEGDEYGYMLTEYPSRDLPSDFMKNLPTAKTSIVHPDDATTMSSRRTFARKENVNHPLFEVTVTITTTPVSLPPSSIVALISKSFKDDFDPSSKNVSDVQSSNDLPVTSFLSEVQKSSSDPDSTATSSPTELTIPPLSSALFGPSTEQPPELNIPQDRRHRFVKPEQWGLPNTFKKVPRLAVL
ncbi:hypothetical protein RvY_12155 [Ramazzottius varieornatus]|uniref:Uncharacterized protein n=1 Tax=Ramazzottius varieornatus TaxID=947166 RepID=A0A1D1VIJ9_RAMVA|nr:hypothetical protein RvY_12155 [Ramazzottius varieornatus]